MTVILLFFGKILTKITSKIILDTFSTSKINFANLHDKQLLKKLNYAFYLYERKFNAGIAN